MAQPSPSGGKTTTERKGLVNSLCMCILHITLHFATNAFEYRGAPPSQTLCQRAYPLSAISATRASEAHIYPSLSRQATPRVTSHPLVPTRKNPVFSI